MPNVVVDANVIVSAALKPASTPAQVVRATVRSRSIVLSPAIFAEFNEVLRRSRIALRLGDRGAVRFLDTIAGATTLITPTISLQICRDPADDKYLELALAAEASFIVPGDLDLLALHPFREISLCARQSFSLGRWAGLTAAASPAPSRSRAARARPAPWRSGRRPGPRRSAPRATLRRARRPRRSGRPCRSGPGRSSRG